MNRKKITTAAHCHGLLVSLLLTRKNVVHRESGTAPWTSNHQHYEHPDLRQQFSDDFSVDIGQSIVATLMQVGQSLVIQTELMHEGRMEIAWRS